MLSDFTHLHATALLACPCCAAVYKLLYTVYTMGDTVPDISASDLDVLKDVGADLNSWIENLRTTMKCKSHQEVTVEKLMKPGTTKETLAKILFEGYQTVYSHRHTFESTRVCVEKLKSELIAAQRSVVKLQQQILEAQAKQLKQVTTVVNSAVDKGIRSYSQIVSETIEKSVPVFTEDKLKKVVQEAVSYDDRSKNIIVFGLAEEKSEALDCKLTELFEEIEEKPSFEAARVGLVSADKCRPVRVSFRNYDTVHRFLLKAKNLKSTTAYKKVYIAPDRTPMERAKHRETVIEMRRLASEDPERHYYIHGGHILCRDKY